MDQPQTRLLNLTSGLFPAARQWQRLAGARLAGYGISSGCVGPLLMIGRSGGGIRQVALAQQLGMEGPSLVRLLDKLATSELIRRECDASDRRANLLWLTDKGQALFVQLEQELIALRAEVLSGLPDKDIEAVLRVYQMLAEAVSRLP
ncbi:MarR family transcriptional regulator [Stenotrophomonas sp. MMGLT7]|uniref:MarR family winged helix-turn-helix transcriptional regulator n=1 Tax=Stenotrophomonas sp. MMGLT7 TaxID=2901227 RepID=UPI001E388177|nr:MarR family transcriptional regulator [Stenotrophomonas sp. MMGLT7]MCD7100169.1 MarR family transcriptional regulator [Stenotrophomonas sp. MMGLT7]